MKNKSLEKHVHITKQEEKDFKDWSEEFKTYKPDPKPWRFLAYLFIISALLLGVLTARLYAEEGETVENEETQETAPEQPENGSTVEISEKLEEISAKVEAVSDEISLQKVDSEKIKEQAEAITELKTQVQELKSASESAPTDAINRPDSAYNRRPLLPLRTSKPIYLYRLSGIYGRTYILASNSDHLSLGFYPSNVDENTYYLSIQGLYYEGEELQPLCGCQIGSDIVDTQGRDTGEVITEEKAVKLMTDPNNWGWARYSIASGAYTEKLCGQREAPAYTIATGMITPARSSGLTDDGTVYLETGLSTQTNPASASLYGLGYNPNQAQNDPVLEMIELGPNTKEWTTQELYIPILIIMATLLLLLFRHR